jgi:ABC-type Na+ transport system ATPase subunit NatA
MTLRYDPENGTIDLTDGSVVAYLTRPAHEADPTLGHKMAAAEKMFEALMEAPNISIYDDPTNGLDVEGFITDYQVWRTKSRAALAKATP